MVDPKYVPERRPLASRSHPLSIRTASWLASRGVSPNAISVVGMICGMLAGIAFASTSHTGLGWLLFLAAAVLIQLRLLANMFDGMVAIQTGKTSRLGELFNEIPDRVSDSAILVGAGYATGGFPAWGYLAALSAVFTAYIRAQGKVAGTHQEFCGPMAKPQRMVLMTGTAMFAAVGPAAWQPALASYPDLGVVALALLVIAIGGLVTSMRRLWRISQALR